MIVGFVGFAKSGKTTASDHLVETNRFKKINFKDALVEEIKRNFPDLIREVCLFMEKHFWEGVKWDADRLFNEKPPIWRALMQNYGTEVRRKDNPNYWTSQWKEQARQALKEGYQVVVDDCRFLNEEQAIRDLGGKIIRIVRTDISEAGEHQSEVEQLQIKNDTTITVAKGEHQKLYELLDAYIREYGE